MNFLGNVVWFFLGGIVQSFIWFLYGCLWSVTIIGIPVGRQCFKLAKMQLAPFGKDIVYRETGTVSFLMNILWLVFGGIELALANLTAGVIFCATIIGIPFGLQCFKLAVLSLLPFGAEVVNKTRAYT